MCGIKPLTFSALSPLLSSPLLSSHPSRPRPTHRLSSTLSTSISPLLSYCPPISNSLPSSFPDSLHSHPWSHHRHGVLEREEVSTGSSQPRTPTRQQSGAVEACWAHNPEVRGSKPRSASYPISHPLAGLPCRGRVRCPRCSQLLPNHTHPPRITPTSYAKVVHSPPQSPPPPLPAASSRCSHEVGGGGAQWQGGKSKSELPDRELNPGRLGESQES
nr:hypothetical protein HmN_000803500 [Hymenolepis microstoma]